MARAGTGQSGWRVAPASTLPRLRSHLTRVPTSVWIWLAIALALRVLLVALTWHTKLTLDPSDFNRSAASIAGGHGYPPTNRAPGGGPSAFRPPAYPFLLAAVYVFAGHPDPAAGRLVGACLGLASVALITLIAFRLWGRRVAMVALGIAAVAPPLVVLSTALISEALVVPLILAAVLAALEARTSPRPIRWAILTGVLVGLAALTRTNALILLIPFALAFLPHTAWRRPRSWVAPAVVILAAGLTIAPWTIRNAVVFGRFIPISDESGYTLAGTYNQVSRASTRFPANWIEAEHGASPEYARILQTARRERWNEPTYGSHLQAQAFQEIASHPAYVLKVAYWNAIRMFDVAEIRLARNNLANTDIPLAPALALMNSAPLLEVLALGGLLIRAARRVPRWFWLVPLSLLTTLFVSGFIRFRAPIDPFLVMLAALFLTDIWESMFRGRSRQGAATGGAGAYSAGS
ncbi:MAG TPA: glycosyltransferase family 39 protein [Solirubrobacteraceae bacterium]|nr:glycosyltransferase family 39 protein [Solirubrobacteraceae bacterium]